MYLSTYKAFEHKPPDLIKERVDKEHGAMLRSALTSISKVNKTDVETLRTSFGVSMFMLCRSSSSLNRHFQSFAKIAHATPEELRNLPGFGAVKVRRVIDAFEKPFRNKATSTIPASQVARDALGRDQDEDEVITDAGSSEQPETREQPESQIHQFGSAANLDLMPPPPPRPKANVNVSPGPSRTRGESPTWDIELDLNEDDFAAVAQAEAEAAKETQPKLDPRLAKKDRINAANAGRVLSSPEDDRNAKRPRRSPSPAWDIELDLN